YVHIRLARPVDRTQPHNERHAAGYVLAISPGRNHYICMRQPALLIVATAILALTPRIASSANLDPSKQQAWSTMDKCSKDSFAKFPDQTKEGEAQRRAYVHNCQVSRSQNSSLPLLLRN